MSRASYARLRPADTAHFISEKCLGRIHSTLGHVSFRMIFQASQLIQCSTKGLRRGCESPSKQEGVLQRSFRNSRLFYRLSILLTFIAQARAYALQIHRQRHCDVQRLPPKAAFPLMKAEERCRHSRRTRHVVRLSHRSAMHVAGK